MSMLEQMASRLATDALNRLSPGIYTNVIDEIWVYQTQDGKFKVSDCPGDGTDKTPGLSYETARETMVAMMAAEAGALVVVPEDALMDIHLAQIAQLLVNSADVDTDASDVADGAAIVGTVKRALDYLDAARDDNRIKYSRIEQLETVSEQKQNEIEGLTVQIQNWYTGANELQDKLLAAQQEIGGLTAKLETATRNAKRMADEAANCEARYEGMEAALRIVLELAGVGK